MRITKWMASSWIAMFIISIVLSGCLKGSNVNNQSEVPAIIQSDPVMGTVLYFGWGEKLAAPALKGEFVPGDHVLAFFTLDYDNQPTNAYFTATNVECFPVDHTYAYVTRGEPVWSDEYADSITSLGLFYHPFYHRYNVDASLFLLLGGNMTSRDDKFKYEMFCNIDSVDSKGVPTVYIRAKREESGTEQAVLQGVYIYAFSLAQLTDRFGRDTTYTSNGGVYEDTFLDFHLKYQSGVDVENKKSVYKSFPEKISIIARRRVISDY